ncbi:glycosyltransferase family 9 protein [Gryllotalpicola ginsengisoli]|uniref:glycosyltransferase family 9 protein n=1 Tax=Gryllotalpicola ginsengisoli TaxID=444608 RepID=UPI0003FB47EA|nr:glycosyltransferase family 9 protein [Gryllotalpicola ginsengisoli]
MTRVLIARQDSAGDVLLTGPAVRAVAASGAEVWFLAGPRGADAARLLPGVSRVLVAEVPWVGDDASFSSEQVTALARRLRRSSIDEAIILTSFHQSPLPLALTLRLAGVRPITGASVDAAGDLLDRRLIPGEDFDEDQPEPLRDLRIVSAAGYQPPDDDDLLLAVRRLPPVEEWLGDDEGFVAVHPGAAVPARAWPAEHHEETVRMLAERGHRVVVTGGPGERELTARVAGSHALDLGGKLAFDELGAVLARAAVTVVGNTGPAHLSAAVGTPVVSLFSPVVPSIRWRPYGVPIVLLGDQQAACRLSRARECPIPGHPCLASVSPERVVAAVEELLPAPSPVAGGRR